MDFIRAALKTAFYDFPLNIAIRDIREGRLDDFTRFFVDVVKWSETAFSITELTKLKEIVSMHWMRFDLRDKEVNESEYARIFLMLNKFGEYVINPGVKPAVKFENLLRWRSLTHDIGEDIPVCSFLAEDDVISGYRRTFFVWEDVLTHDDKRLNLILDRGLSDVHAHLFASTDVFAENWIALMNVLPPADEGKVHVHQDFDLNLWDCETGLSFRHIGLVAAAIRADICAYLYQNIPFERNKIVRMLKSQTDCIAERSDIEGTIDSLRALALKIGTEDAVYDYAINMADVSEFAQCDVSSPYMIHVGERRLLYNFFYKYYGGDGAARQMAPYFYLYCLIKSKYRREFVQTNRLVGFENFKEYQDSKNVFSSKRDFYPTITYRYAVQTAVGRDGSGCFEPRVTSDAVRRLRKIQFDSCIFEGSHFFTKDVSDNVRLLVHFIKRDDRTRNDNKLAKLQSYRHFYLRESLRKESEDFLHEAGHNSRCKEDGIPLLVGIDAAGSELNCRPEVFAPFFRRIRNEGITNVTYHAGEDFYDIVDGLRTIDEAMLFLDYTNGCRLGHALALGINPHRYYRNRHYSVIMPKQYMLDNMVWLIQRGASLGVDVSPYTRDFAYDVVHRLLEEIGYGEDVDIYRYWQSMLLRGDGMDIAEGSSSKPDRVMQCKHPDCENARKSGEAVLLHERYESDFSVRRAGDIPDSFKVPEQMADDVRSVQERMMSDIEERGICIECNPSSNLLIGPFGRYDELPITRFMSVGGSPGHNINISINTDDRGVFATSIRNEYSLVAISLMKQENDGGKKLFSREEVYSYLERIIGNGHCQRFGEPSLK